MPQLRWCSRGEKLSAVVCLFQVYLFTQIMQLIESFRHAMYNPKDFRRFELFLFKEIERAAETVESKCLCVYNNYLYPQPQYRHLILLL